MQSVNPILLQPFAKLLGPKGFCSDQDVISPWLSDWRGLYHGQACAMLSPETTEQVAQTVKIAFDLRIPLVPQGGNTSMVGGATPPEDGSALILSLRRMNRIRALSPCAGIAVAEAGVILSALHDAAAEQEMRFPLTLGARGSATVGGLCATNAGGTQVLRFGTMRTLVCGLEAVLPDGSTYDGLAALKKDNRGYDFNHLLVGSEGTLGIITAASLKLVPAVADRAVGWLAVPDPQAALRALRLMEHKSGNAIESFEIVPKDSLDLVIKHIPGTRAPFGRSHPWLVLVDYVADTVGVAADRLGLLMQAVLEAGIAIDAIIAANNAQAEAFWRLRESVSEAERACGPTIAHDISVPVDAMPDFLIAAAKAVEAAHPGVIASAFGHLGDGNVHFHLRAPAGVDGARWRAETGKPASRLVYDLVSRAGGSISAEHGIGQMKLDDLARLSSPARLSMLRAVKLGLDPRGLLNPGKLVPLASDKLPA
jgi:FAD/FMN-containing dehydrogenase